jgi:hypothetical protein
MKRVLIAMTGAALASLLTMSAAQAINTGGNAKQKVLPRIAAPRQAAHAVKRGWAARMHRHRHQQMHARRRMHARADCKRRARSTRVARSV